MLRILTLSTLFPDATRPNFGVFVERQTLGLAAHPDVSLQAVAPIGLPPGPLRHLGHYATLAKLPTHERWKGIELHRPRFTVRPFLQGRHHAAALQRALIPVLDTIREDFAFDVIDASFFFPDGPAAVALGKRYGVPVSIKARGSDIHIWGNAPATAAQVRAAGRNTAGMLAVSAAMKADMVAMGLPADRIRVHHTGVDQDRFHPVDRVAAKAALGVTGPLVVSVGALIPRKGHDIVIDAVAALPGVTLLIAGQGPARSTLEARIARLGIADRVRLLGAVPHAEIPKLIAAADVSALASESEGLANAWVESLACGTPIVITDAGGALDVVTSPKAGRVTIGDPLAFAAAIGALLADPPPPQATRATVASFTWEANTAALYEHLATLAANRS
ncbi:glycosyltransferase involved in cell wall biosynthesis [Sphingomonas sp. PP-CE-1A-559]|uniref:glycosyltransferase n=1 Tax=Sphingomonas sp. PP-CE-1A-559 TaxID=2135657 RepID=UPI001054F060|nr:glycosyltransferase [Sphingomonas sp. PP-CE-1A-559]TCP91963.1 glycosyltransferase involved in cell wall biosynthesis [Sphingomonas sp. PP-CE-1A-559]